MSETPLWADCPKCGGSGGYIDHAPYGPCARCDGSGRVTVNTDTATGNTPPPAPPGEPNKEEERT